MANPNSIDPAGPDDQGQPDDQPKERPSTALRHYVVRGGRIVEVIVGPARETR